MDTMYKEIVRKVKELNIVIKCHIQEELHQCLEPENIDYWCTRKTKKAREKEMSILKKKYVDLYKKELLTQTVLTIISLEI